MPTTATAAAPAYEFDDDFQTKVAAMTVRDTVFLQKVDGLIKPEYFTNEVEATLVNIGVGYFDIYKKAPDAVTFAALIKKAAADKKIRRDLLVGVKDAFSQIMRTDISDRDFVIDEVATFARQRALEEALITSVEALDKRDFSKIEPMIRKALEVGVTDDAGEYDYAERITARTERRIDIAAGTYKHDGITTGYAELDKELHHRGWGRGELSCLMGPPKSGKSMSLGEFGKNAWMAGYNVLYVTLEVSADIIADRLDANLADTMMKELHLKPADVRDKIKKISATSAIFKIHEFASGSMKISQLRRLVERYRARGILFDLIIVDYADIMAPERAFNEPIENSKSIWLALRALAFDEHAALLTATQTNREGAKKTTGAATDVAEDFNKVRIVDVLLGINATMAEKAAGEARLAFVAVRNGEEGFSLHISQDRAKMKFIKKVLGRI